MIYMETVLTIILTFLVLCAIGAVVTKFKK